MVRNFSPQQNVLTAKDATGIGTVLLVEDWDTIVVAFATDNNANLTVKAQGSIQEEKPDFASAQADDNIWDYVQMKDLEDNSSVDGDTGFAVTGTDDTKQYEVNVSGLRWFTLNVTARSAGDVTAIVKGYSMGS